MSETSILGLGESGRAAARLVLNKGGEVYVSDSKLDASTTARGAELRALGADVQVGGHDLDRIARSGTVVASPGIPPGAPVLAGLRERGVRWISELELAFRFFQGPLIAVTGTNGKTTTSVLTAHLLREGGLDVALGGNIGAGMGPAASELALRETPPDWYVVEASSFQLADVESFRPDIGVLTNLAPDHLDRYEDVADYYADKARLFERANDSSRWVLNADDEPSLRLGEGVPGERWFFSATGKDVEGAVLRHGDLVFRSEDSDELLLERTDLPLLGAHNVANALAATVASRLAGVPADRVAAGLSTASPLPHRLEPVVDAGGILWVNDSKATNVAAAVSAVKSFDRPVVVLLGGKDKGEDFSPLRDVLRGRARAVLAYGAAGDRIAKTIGTEVPLQRVEGGFETVVRIAANLAVPGDVVLLTPACSSFDMFRDYEDRGRTFATLARAVALDDR